VPSFLQALALELPQPILLLELLLPVPRLQQQAQPVLLLMAPLLQVPLPILQLLAQMEFILHLLGQLLLRLELLFPHLGH